MKKLTKDALNNTSITWVKQGDSVPLCQGMALNRLNNEYPTKKEYRQGWFIYSVQENQADDQPFKNGTLYYLIERMTQHDDKSVSKCLIAFQENGCSIEGYAIIQ